MWMDLVLKKIILHFNFFILKCHLPFCISISCPLTFCDHCMYKRGQLSQLWLWNYHSDWDRKRAHHVRQPFDSFSPPYSDFYDVWFVASNTIFSWRFEVRNEDHFLKLMKLWEVLKKAGGGVKSNGDKLPQGAPSITKAMKQN